MRLYVAQNFCTSTDQNTTSSMIHVDNFNEKSNCIKTFSFPLPQNHRIKHVFVDRTQPQNRVAYTRPTFANRRFSNFSQIFSENLKKSIIFQFATIKQNTLHRFHNKLTENLSNFPVFFHLPDFSVGFFGAILMEKK